MAHSSIKQYLGSGSCCFHGARTPSGFPRSPLEAAFLCHLTALSMLQSILAVYQVASRTPPRASLLVELEPVTSAEVK